MNIHYNARLTPLGRERMVRAIVRSYEPWEPMEGFWGRLEAGEWQVLSGTIASISKRCTLSPNAVEMQRRAEEADANFREQGFGRQYRDPGES